MEQKKSERSQLCNESYTADMHYSLYLKRKKLTHYMKNAIQDADTVKVIKN